MNEDTEVYLELADDEHPDAETAAEDTARLLMEVQLCRQTSHLDQNGTSSSQVEIDASSTSSGDVSAGCSSD